MSKRRLIVVTATMMLSLFLASMEISVVATAMPTIVAELGGLSIYAWVFSAYMLTSTTTTPIFGKLSDVFGRAPVYFVAMAIFLIGSALCGIAQTMPQLVFFRALQGIGAGGLLPLVIIIIGDIFSFEQRARIQGVFSAVWGVSSVIGPLIGGFLVDRVDWPWVFWINVPLGLAAAALMRWSWREVNPPTPARVDWTGAALLTGGVVTMLLALLQLNEGLGWTRAPFWTLLVLSIVLLAVLFRVERRAADPLLPLDLFRDRLFAAANGHGFLSSFAVFGAIAFIPFFVQSVLGTSATVAGASLTPLSVCWVLASMVGSRALLRMGYRTIALSGMVLAVIGMGLMAQIGSHTPLWVVLVDGCIMGVGMGLSVPAFLIAVQSSVPRRSLGTATSTFQFSRNIGGTIGVSVLGLILSLRLSAGLAAVGLDPAAVSLGGLLDPVAGAETAAALAPLRDVLAASVRAAFVAALVASVLGLVATALAPGGRIVQAAPARSVSDSTASEHSAAR